VERFPPAVELPFVDAVSRRLRVLDPFAQRSKVQDVVAGRREADVRKALNATLRARPDQPFPFFVKCLGREVKAETAAPKPGIRPVRTSADPY
jgi:hypothetical protein